MFLEEKENRNCGCANNNYLNQNNGCNCSNTQMTFYNMDEGIENISSNNSCDCESKQEMREEMIQKIRCYDFAITELALYLDTHPEDEKALCLHRKYCKEVKDLKDKYQKVFGPLTINYPCNKWRWLEEPWPWERGNF